MWESVFGAHNIFSGFSVPDYIPMVFIRMSAESEKVYTSSNISVSVPKPGTG